MTSAKKRVYKTKRQKDQQKRITAQYKLASKSQESFPDFKARKSTIDAINLRNLYRERNPVSQFIRKTERSDIQYPNRIDEKSNYDPLDELVNSPLHSVNELESDVDHAIRSFEREKPPEKEKSECSESNLSSQSIMFIDNGKVLNNQPRSIKNVYSRDFRFDQDWKFLSIDGDVPSEFQKEVPKKQSETPSYYDISKSWDLFEGQEMLSMNANSLITSSMNKNIDNSATVDNGSKSSGMDVDEEFDLQDFLEN